MNSSGAATRRWLYRSALALSLAAAGALLLTGSAASQAARLPGWHPAGTFRAAAFGDVIAVSSHDGWLAGIRQSQEILVEHWDGSRWDAVRTPRAMFSDRGVVIGASSAANAWVYTFFSSGAGDSYAVAWHWNGRGWRRFRLPGGSSVSATTVFSRTDAWAFGDFGSGRRPVPYALRYDGRRWQRVRAPVQPASASALSARDIWVAGRTAASLRTGPVSYEAANWTGASWHVLPFPKVHVPGRLYLTRPLILALSPANIWIDFQAATKGVLSGGSAVLLHYDGSAWTQAWVPNRSVTWTANMTPDGHRGIWVAVATDQKFGSALYDYRNGHWSAPAELAKPGRYTFITSLAALPGSAVTWAAGYSGSNGANPDPRAVLYQRAG